MSAFEPKAIQMQRRKARWHASDVGEWGTGALWGTSLGDGKRGNVLSVHLECWVPRFPSWRDFMQVYLLFYVPTPELNEFCVE